MRTAPAIVLVLMALFYHMGESAPSVQPIRIAGQALESGKPFEGARIELHPAVPDSGPTPLASARTGPDGAYELLAPESGAYRVIVQAKDRLALEYLAVPLVEEVYLPPVELVRFSTIEIQALGPDGRPLAGLPMRVEHSPNKFFRDRIGWQPAVRRGITGPDGKLTLPRWNLEPLDIYVADGQVASEIRGGSVTVRPEPSAAVPPARPVMAIGKVVDAETGKPIAGALVWSGLPPELPPVRTAEDGTFGLPVLGRSLGVAAAGYETSEAQATAKRVAVALKRTATIRGQVVDRAGAPIAGAAIRINSVPRLLSRADGSFSIPGLLPGGAYRVAAHRQGYGRSEIGVKAGETSVLRIVLGSGATVAGRIVDEDGNPVAGAEVTIVLEEMQDPGNLAQARSDANGAFAIPHLVPGSFRIFARRAGFTLALRSGLVVPEGDVRIDAGEIVLKGGSAIEGRVTEARGGAIEGVEIWVFSDLGPLDPAKNFAREVPPPDVRSGPDGLFRIEDLERGRRYTLMARHPAYPDETISGVEAPTADPVPIELQPARTLAGKVVNSQGEPVPNAEVATVYTTGPGSRSSGTRTWTGSVGEFQIGGLKPAPFDLYVSARGYRDTLWKGIQIPRDRDPEPVAITMERGADIEVRARDGEGNPLAGVQVTYYPKLPQDGWMGRFRFERLVTDAGGSVRIADLAPAEYIVSGSFPGAGEDAQTSVRLGSGTARADLVLARGVEVAGRVVNEEGEPVLAASVTAEAIAEEQGFQSRSGSSRADGSFAIPGLQDGEYLLTASSRDHGTSEPQRLRLAGSGVEGLELRLSRGAAGTLSGRVLGFPPEALSQLRIEATAASIGWENFTSPADGEGRYRFSGLRPGRWTVRAYLSGSGRGVQEEAVVEPGAETLLDLQFPEGLTYSGRVALDGRPLRGAQISTSSFEITGSFARAASDSEGRFSLGPLQPGSHTLLIHSPETALGTFRTVQLQEGQEIRLEIETGGIQGRILSASGEPVPDAVVQLRVVHPATGHEAPDLGPTLRSDGEGAFEMLSIPAGVYNVVVQKHGYKETRMQLEIGPGAVGSQDIVLNTPLP